MVASLAEVLGADFAPAFGTFFPLISKFYVSNFYLLKCPLKLMLSSVQKKNRSLSDRSSAIGCLAEIISGMKGSITPSTEPLLELFYRALSDDEPDVQSNAAFASGLLVEYSEVDMSPQYLHLLAALRPFFVVTPDASHQKKNARDNAAGAVARLIIRNTSAVPLDQVLPVFIETLPLQTDYLENRPVFRALFHLFRSYPQTLYPYMDRLLQVFAHVLDPSGPEQVNEETKNELIALIGALNGEDHAKVQAAGLARFVPGA